MANGYFEHSTFRIPAATKANASDVNNIADQIEVGFDKLPTEAQLKSNTTLYADTDTGTANAYVIAMPYALGSYVDGMQVLFKAANANTGASTLNIDSLGAKVITRKSGDAVVAGDIVANEILHLIYNSTSDTFLIQGAYQEAVDAAAAAIAAQAAAETAQGLAEDAQTAAETAQASSEAALYSFVGTYYGAAASDPALDPNGQAPTAGDIYLNTTTDRLRFYNGAGWEDSVKGLVGAIGVDEFTATAGQTTFVGTHSAEFVNIYLNGVLLQSTDYTWTQATLTLVLNTGASLNDTVTILAVTSTADFDTRYLGPFSTDPTLAPDGSALLDGMLYWNTTVGEMRVYNLSATSWEPTTSSVTVTEHLFSGDGTTVAFDCGRGVQDDVLAAIVVGGVPQPSTKYSFAGSVCTFTTAPPTGTNNIFIKIFSPIEAYPDPIETLTSNESYTVGTGGDFTTLSEALEYCQKRRPVGASAEATPRIDLTFVAGYVLDEQIFLNGVDLGYVTLHSTDATVTIDRSSIQTQVEGWMYCVFYLLNATGPTIRCLFDMDTSGVNQNQIGVYLNTSELVFDGGAAAGIRNCSGNNIQMYHSTLVANNNDLSGAAANGIQAHRGSIVNVRGCDISGCGAYALNLAEATICNAESAVMSNCARAVSAVEGCYVNAQTSTALNCTIAYYATKASTINAAGSDASGSSQLAYALESSNVNLNNSTANNTTYRLIECYNSSAVEARTGTFTNGVVGIICDANSKVNARSSSFSNFTGRIAQAVSGSIVNLHSSVMTSTYNSSNILAQNSSEIVCRVASLTNATAGSIGGRLEGASKGDFSNSNFNTAASEYQVFTGSTMTINGATGGTTTNIAVNTLNAGGIIFQ